MPELLQQHSNELMILFLSGMVLGTLLVLVPQLLRAHQRALEWQHEEHMRAVSQGQPLPSADYLAHAAGRTASLVPMVVMCAAGTVTCFLVSFKPQEMFAVSLVVWCVAGVVGLAAITGGVALMGRLAQLGSGAEEAPPDNPLLEEEKSKKQGWQDRDKLTG
jgi:hypothetical protein